MIRVHRGTEPPELARERHRRLAKLALEWRRRGFDSSEASAVAEFARAHEAELDRGYGVARDVLRDRLHKKCSYCERCVSPSDPIDHYRPRRPCERGDGTFDHAGYWWLTWSWSNLLLSCGEHNGIKDNEFEVDGDRMPPLTWDPANELPKLLDPAATDPQEHLEFSEGSDGHWTVQGKTPLGASTAKALQLNRPSDRYDQRLRILEMLVTDLREEAARGREAVGKLWRRKAPIVLDEHAEYRMLARAYLASRIADLLREHGLELPPLSDDAPAEAAEPLFPHRPELEGMSEELVLRIFALGVRPKRRETHAVIVELLSLRPWTLTELAEVLPQQVDTIRRHLEELRTSGHVEFDGECARRAGARGS